MSDSRSSLVDAVRSTGVAARELAEADAVRLLRRLERRFGRHGGAPLWERLTHSRIASVQDAEGWRMLCRMVSDAPVLLVENTRPPCGFAFRDGREMEAVLAESPSFVFYVTNERCEYLLAFNDHDFLIGVGPAAAWVSAGIAEPTEIEGA